MKSLIVKPVSCLRGYITLLGDKSIAHRSIILSAIAFGRTKIKNFPTNKDCLTTIKAFKELGIKITSKAPNVITVFGKGLYGLREPRGSIFLGDSGTSLRLLLGILAGQNFEVSLSAAKLLSQRPMRRVSAPLRMMGARIKSKVKSLPTKSGSRQNVGKKLKVEEYPPITIKGGNLRAVSYKMPVASAQVKSAILLAGLYAKGKTQVIEPIKTRDHTERMLRLFKADIKVKQNTIVIKGNQELISPKEIYIPGDISSAGFFIVLATIMPNSQVLIKNVSLNPSRIGIIRVLKRMGADIRFSAVQCKPSADEPMGDILIKSSSLRATKVRKEEVPSLIDELPILMVAACYAKGKTVFEGVSELRVKETDRIKSMSENLRTMGVDIKIMGIAKSENIIIKGVKELHGKRVKSFGDHRTAMSMVVAGLRARGKTLIDDISCINKSFPDFLNLLDTIIH